jgi:hypothetical protein
VLPARLGDHRDGALLGATAKPIIDLDVVIADRVDPPAVIDHVLATLPRQP